MTISCDIAARLVIKGNMKHLPAAMIAASLTGITGLLALPVLPFSMNGSKITMLNMLEIAGTPRRLALVILVPVVLALLVGVLSLKGSRRWQTGIAGFVLLVPILLTAMAKSAGPGARLGTLGAVVAAVCAIALTIKPLPAQART